MDIIHPIGPIDRDVDPVWRVERANDRERDRQHPEQGEEGTRERAQEEAPAPAPEGPVVGDDGRLHIDVRA